MAKTKTKSTSGKTSVTPLGDRVLVRRTAAEETSKGGIILPDSAKTLKVKDRVLFSSYSGSEIKLDGEDYLIMSEDEILAVID